MCAEKLKGVNFTAVDYARVETETACNVGVGPEWPWRAGRDASYFPTIGSPNLYLSALHQYIRSVGSVAVLAMVALKRRDPF